MKIKDFIKKQWQVHPVQMVGVGLLIISVLLRLIGKTDFAWYALGIVGLITASCALVNKFYKPTRTVSQWIQDLTAKKWIDYLVGTVIIVFAAHQHFSIYGFEEGMKAAYWPFVIGLAIHFFGNKD